MKLHGTWSLQSCIGRSSSGKKFFPYGENPSGQLIYTPEGHVNVLLMASGRLNFSSNDLSAATVDEKAAAFDSFDAYAGSYCVDQSTRKVIHRITAGRVPNWVGFDHIRYFELEENNLKLLTEPFEMAGESWQVEVLWDRA